MYNWCPVYSQFHQVFHCSWVKAFTSFKICTATIFPFEARSIYNFISINSAVCCLTSGKAITISGFSLRKPLTTDIVGVECFAFITLSSITSMSGV